MRKLVATLACRNNGSRLYGKPLHNLDIEKKVTVLDHLLTLLKQVKEIDEIVLGISVGVENDIFMDVAKKHNISYIRGDETDVLGRLILCGNKANATDVFRVTTESPFTYFEKIEEAWKIHVEEDNDATFVDNVPDACGFEIMKLEALKKSHKDGEDLHRSELCSKYIRDNKDKFKIKILDVPEEFKRFDIRLTVDYPEDLIVCRAVYEALKDKAPLIPLKDIISFLDTRKDLLKLTAPFCEEGYSTMYI